MKAFVVILVALAATAAYLVSTGQIQVKDGELVYVAPPSHEERHGHSSAEHRFSYCATIEHCAGEVAEEHQSLVNTEENGALLRSVVADGPKVIYDYSLAMSEADFQRSLPPPDEWFAQMHEDFCVDEMNWPMTDMGVITVMRFHGSDEAFLGEVRIEECIR